MSLRALVVDDEDLARERVATLVRQTPALELVGEAAHGLQALDMIASLAPDLVFLDVEMPELDGFDVVAALSGDKIPGFVFVTAYEEYAVKAFEVEAIDYLRKPVTPERFHSTVQRAVRRLRDGARSGRLMASIAAAHARHARGHRTRFVVRRGSTHTFVAVQDVAWIDGADNYLQLHEGDRTHLVRGTMKDLMRELDPASFLRIHRSTIVNVSRIVAIEAQPAGGYIVRLSDGTRLRTSRQYAEGIRRLVAPGGR
jgi:two-component system LytT family response regulator